LLAPLIYAFLYLALAPLIPALPPILAKEAADV
jgi:hypothetical protein